MRWAEKGKQDVLSRGGAKSNSGQLSVANPACRQRLRMEMKLEGCTSHCRQFCLLA